MSIPTSCSHCRAAYTLNDALLGKTVRCKNCQQSFLVRDASVAAAAPAAARKAGTPKPRRRPEVADDRDGDDEPRPSRKKGSPVVPSLLIGGGVAAVLVLGCCGVPGYFVYRAYRAGEQLTTDFQQQMDQAQAQLQKQIEEERNRRDNRAGPAGLPGNGGGAPPATSPAGDRAQGQEPPVRDDRGGRQSRESSGIRFLKPIENVADALDALRGTDQARQQQAADWLARAPLDPARQADAARALEPLLDNRNTFVRLSAARALATWGDKDSVPALVKALDQRFGAVHGDIQRAAMDALARLADERGAEAVAPFLANAFMNEDARRSLKAMGPVAEKAVLKCYFHPDGGARERAADLLRGYGTKTSAIVLQGALDLKSDQLERRRRAVQWFAQAPADADARAAAARALEPLLQDNDTGVREQAARALVTWATADNAPGLRRLLDDPSANLRRPAIQALGKLKDEPAVVPIAVRLLDGGDRRVAAEALIAIGPKAEGAVLTGLNNPDRGVRVEVCRVLGAVGTRKSLAPLQAAAVYARTKRETDVLEAALLAIDKVNTRLKSGAPAP